MKSSDAICRDVAFDENKDPMIRGGWSDKLVNVVMEILGDEPSVEKAVARILRREKRYKMAV